MSIPCRPKTRRHSRRISTPLPQRCTTEAGKQPLRDYCTGLLLPEARKLPAAWITAARRPVGASCACMPRA
jgi:hypothetical protein